jgi:thiamine-monophosphate kinase
MGEFDLISTYFSQLTAPHAQLVLGIGDDAAIWAPTPGKQMIFTVDTLHVGRHFLPDDPPSTIAHKALAVNLSDCAAMGAKPVGFLLSLSLPHADCPWISEFSKGLSALANEYQLALMGGDTTQGPLSVSITLIGEVIPGQALLRSGAKVGEDIYVSGTLGLPSLGLATLKEHRHFPEAIYDEIVAAYREPRPQVALGQALVGIATACIDISDGFVADLRHVLHQSHCGARVIADHLPMHPLLKEYAQPKQALQWCLTGGDDYQLIVTAPVDKREAIAALGVALTRVGQITPGSELICDTLSGESLSYAKGGWEHFSDE